MPGAGNTGLGSLNILPMTTYATSGEQALANYRKAITTNKGETKIVDTQEAATALQRAQPNSGWINWIKNPNYKLVEDTKYNLLKNY